MRVREQVCATPQPYLTLIDRSVSVSAMASKISIMTENLNMFIKYALNFIFTGHTANCLRTPCARRSTCSCAPTGSKKTTKIEVSMPGQVAIRTKMAQRRRTRNQISGSGLYRHCLDVY